jgi:restriction system protein
MARSRPSFLEDLLTVLSRLPWQLCAGLGVLSALGLHMLAAEYAHPLVAGALTDLTRVQAHAYLATFTSIGQYLAPTLCVLAAVMSFTSGVRDEAVYAEAARDPHAAMAGMSWTDFEVLTGEVFRRRGFRVQRRGGSQPDGGIDLVLEKDCKRFLVQCKHWRAQRVGVSVVREMNGVVAARSAAGGFLVTSGSFTSEAQVFAKECGIELIDGTALMLTMSGDAASAAAEPDRAETTMQVLAASSVNACPECGSPMVKRTARRGGHSGKDFMGCSRYPHCLGLRTLD